MSDSNSRVASLFEDVSNTCCSKLIVASSLLRRPAACTMVPMTEESRLTNYIRPLGEGKGSHYAKVSPTHEQRPVMAAGSRKYKSWMEIYTLAMLKIYPKLIFSSVLGQCGTPEPPTIPEPKRGFSSDPQPHALLIG